MRLTVCLVAALSFASIAASAQEAAPSVQLRRGQVLRDADQNRLGVIDRVLPDGSAQIIYSSRFATIPAKSISVVDGVAKTTLTRKDVSKLR